jgi:two-component system, NarL family, sensor kinase
LAAKIAYVVLQPAWAPAIACGITLPLLLLPDGRLRSRRWRPMAVAAVAGAVLALVAGSLAPDPGGSAVPQPAGAGRHGR